MHVRAGVKLPLPSDYRFEKHNRRESRSKTTIAVRFIDLRNTIDKRAEKRDEIRGQGCGPRRRSLLTVP